MEAGILIVEDDADCRRLCLRALRKSGYRAAAVRDGESGIEAARRSRPDLVLLDLVLGEVNGFEVMERLPAGIPVLVMTGQVDPGQLLNTASRRLHAGDFLHKPFTLDELRRRVERLLAASKKSCGCAAAPGAAPEAAIERGPLTLNPALCEVRLGGRSRRLGSGQCALLYALMRARGPIAREELLHQVWSHSENPSTVQVAIKRLRITLSRLGGPEIRAVSHGYELIIPGESSSDDYTV